MCGFVQRSSSVKKDTIDTEEEAKKIASVVVEFTKTGSTLFIPPYLDKKAYKLLTDEQRLGPRIMKILPITLKPAKARRKAARAAKRTSLEITEIAQTAGEMTLQTPKSTRQSSGEIPIETPKIVQKTPKETPSPSPDALSKQKKSKKRIQDIDEDKGHLYS